MKASRIVALLVLVALVAAASWYVFFRPRTPATLTIDYAKVDGTLATWTISQRPPQSGESAADYLHESVLYAAVQEVAGPPSDVEAVRFPPRTHVQSVSVDGSTATVDLSRDVAQQTGTFGENGEFKALVFTLTSIPGIHSVQILVDGRRVATLPGGNFELDTPLTRSDW
ncbi:MAG TPA: GerMN domain-containing protein [Candidatus Tyrphobacter sp.]